MLIDCNNSVESLNTVIAGEKEVGLDLYMLSILQSLNIDINGIMKENGLSQIAVYGMGKVGKAFTLFMKTNSIIVKYGVDRDPNLVFVGLDMRHSPNEITDDVDAIVVTSSFSFEEIADSISNLDISIKIIKLRELINCFLMKPIPLAF